MKRLLIPAVLFSIWMALLHTDLPVQGNLVPALGRFLNPFQGFWQNVSPHQSATKINGTVAGKVTILFDEREVPHIYAENLEDALYAQGYLHAAHRLFAMDITTRSAAGRLSELVGSRTLDIDRKQRERGYEWLSERKAQFWENHPDYQPLIDAYVRGINSYIHSLNYASWPLEYKIFSYPPVTWTSTHTALMATSMAISLCLGEDDLEFSIARSALSPEDYEFLFPDHNPKESPVIPAEVKWDFVPLQPDREVIPSPPPPSRHTADPQQRSLNGSNSWAVTAAKTQNGAPILANDPHLGLTLPNIWYEMEIHTSDISVHGATIPGIPFIIIGFNEKIAWGSTNSGQDVLDWYQIHWKDSTRHQYMLDGKLVDATLRPEVISVRGAHAVIDTIRYTQFGPVTHTGEHKDMAMRWIAHQKATSNDLEYLLKINRAAGLKDYRHAVSHFQYPAQNKIFASTEGDIAMSVAGVIPLRARGQGETLTRGDDTRLDWNGYIPFDHAPYVINPSTGYVSSANQVPAAPSYPYPFFGKRYFEDYRGRTVNMLLDSASAVTPDDMKAMQQNNFNLHAAELLPLLLHAVQLSACTSPAHDDIVATLRQWNYVSHRDSLAPVYFDLWYKALEEMTWDELDSLGVMRPEKWRLIEIVRDFPTHRYFDRIHTKDKTETFADIACATLETIVVRYDELPKDRQKNWGQYKQAHIPHLARLPDFGSGYVHASGGTNIINAMNVSHGPSWRMVVELTSPPTGWVNYPGGQSGDPASPHYRDMLAPFFEGEYYEVALRKDPAAWSSSRQIQIMPR